MTKISDLKNFLENKCCDYYQTISIVSQRCDNEAKKSMIDDNKNKIYNYDQGILKKIKYEENNLCSVDGIDIKDETIYFIEFKDGKIFGKNKQNERKIIRLKAFESLIEILKIPIDITFADICLLKKIFILVYSEEIHLQGKDFKLEAKSNLKAQVEEFHTQLKRYQIDGLYTDIHIYEKKEFEEKFLRTPS